MNPNAPAETPANNSNIESSSDTEKLSTEKIYSELVDNLENLVKVYRSLLEVVRREKEILVASKLDELNENNKSKDAMLIRIRSLENQRTKWARDLAAAVGADVENPRLLDIANHSELRMAERLRNMHSVLDLLVRRVADVNKQNEELVQAALSNITGAMEAIRDGLKPKPTYGRQGSFKGEVKSEGASLVSKEA